MKIQLVNADSRALLRNIKRLYKKAFPRYERKPFRMIINNVKRGKAEIHAIIDEKGVFCGLVIFEIGGELVLLDYFAVCPKLRGNSIGTAALKLINERFSDKRLFLEIELSDGDKDPNDVKRRRKEFYLRGGMKETGLTVSVFGVELEILSRDSAVSFKEYYDFYCDTLGKLYSGHIREVKNG